MQVPLRPVVRNRLSKSLLTLPQLALPAAPHEFWLVSLPPQRTFKGLDEVKRRSEAEVKKTAAKLATDAGPRFPLELAAVPCVVFAGLFIAASVVWLVNVV